MLSIIAAEEDNLLATWQHARAHGWWRGVFDCMGAPRHLYHARGRGAAWQRLVETVVPDFVNPKTDAVGCRTERIFGVSSLSIASTLLLSSMPFRWQSVWHAFTPIGRGNVPLRL